MEYLGYIVTRNEEDENILYCSKPGFTTFMVLVNDLLANTNETDLYLGDPDQAEHYLQDNSSTAVWA
jgi:hypothetical protein